MGNGGLRSALLLLPPHTFPLAPPWSSTACRSCLLHCGPLHRLLVVPGPPWSEAPAAHPRPPPPLTLAFSLLFLTPPPSPHSSACVAFLPLSSVSFPRDTTTNTDRLSCAPVGLLKPAGTTCIPQPYPVLSGHRHLHTPAQLGIVSPHHQCKEQGWCQAAPRENRGMKESPQGSWQ